MNCSSVILEVCKGFYHVNGSIRPNSTLYGSSVPTERIQDGLNYEYCNCIIHKHKVLISKNPLYILKKQKIRSQALSYKQVYKDNFIVLFQDYFIQSLHQESEGIVRKEIATLISVIYEYQDLPEHVIPRLYDIMTHAVMVDLHWEVKVKALNFWQKVLERHLMDQGVIDGTFPKITFSKEHRKIVTLNEIEIKRRLVKVRCDSYFLLNFIKKTTPKVLR